MTLLERLKKWWEQNILRHGESEDISKDTGLSEGDMSGPISDADWTAFLNQLPSAYRSLFTKEDMEKWLKDKDPSYLQGDALKIMGSILAAYMGSYSIMNGLSSRDSDNDILLKALYGDAYTPGNNSGILSGLKDLFSGMSNQLGGALSGLGSGLLGIGSELGSSILNYKNQEKLIDKQNEYNTPANQMQRFADAGLNPNLIYGLGSNGNQPASGSVAPVDFTTAQRENRLAKMQIETQTAMARADIADKMANVHLKESQANNVDAQTAYQGLVNNNYIRDLDSQIQQREAQTDNLRTQKRELLANATTAEERAKIASRLAEIDKAIAENDKIISDKKAEYAEATAFTEMLGNIFGVNFGLGASFNVGRGRNTTISKRVN